MGECVPEAHRRGGPGPSGVRPQGLGAPLAAGGAGLRRDQREAERCEGAEVVPPRGAHGGGGAPGESLRAPGAVALHDDGAKGPGAECGF